MTHKKPTCQNKNCNHSGLLDEGLCAIHYYHKYKKWSKKFESPKDKSGRSACDAPMKFKKVK